MAECRACRVLWGKVDIAGSLVLATAFYLASRTPGDGTYEVGIYQAYPRELWVAVILGILLGLAGTLGNLSPASGSGGWLSNLLLVIISGSFVLSLPFLRDYAFVSQWDPVNHFAHVADILEHGRPFSENFYPVVHCLAAFFSLITGVLPQETILVLPVLFHLFYVANTAFAIWTLDPDPRARRLTITLASPLLFANFGSVFRPTHLAVCTLPLFVGWLWRSRGRGIGASDAVPLLLLLVFLPFLHPLAVISAAAVILLFGAASSGSQLRKLPRRTGSLLNPLFILLIIWLTWFMSFRLFGATTRRLVETFVEGLSGAHSLGGYVDSAQKARLSWREVVSLIGYTYGPMLLYLGLAAIAVIQSLRQSLRRGRPVPAHLLALSLFVLGFSALSGLSLFRDMVTAQPVRYASYAVAMVPPLTGGVFARSLLGLETTNVQKRLLKFALLLTILTTSVLGVLNTYPSELTGQPNHQFSFAQQTGVAFLVDKVDYTNIAEEEVYTPFSGTATLSSVFNAYELAEMRRESPFWRPQLAPAHFGYGPDELGIEFEGPGYLWVTAHERAYYTEVWPEGGRFTPADFQRLESDSNWAQIYSSGGMTIWRRRTGE
jgi:hypothetical protein